MSATYALVLRHRTYRHLLIALVGVLSGVATSTVVLAVAAAGATIGAVAISGDGTRTPARATQ